MPTTQTQLRIASPIGPLLLASDGAALAGVWMQGCFDGCVEAQARFTPCGDALLDEAARQLVAYFDGRLSEFDLPLAASGGEFEREVWAALRAIPYGTTVSYGEIAKRVGEPGTARAVGLANNRNPLPIVVPCHRVIGADGALVGFGGGLARKRWLLAHEALRAAGGQSVRRGARTRVTLKSATAP
jgi:methylated-DNA-[protein]-cysteine S-methyltransferase